MTLSGHGAVQRGALSVARVGSIPWEWRVVIVDHPPLPGCFRAGYDTWSRGRSASRAMASSAACDAVSAARQMMSR
jgi:hypothetical protein